MNDHDEVRAIDLSRLPAQSELLSVSAEPAVVGARSCLRVRLTDEVAKDGVPDADYIDMPTFVRLPIDFENGAIEVDILSRLTPDAPEYARGFAGIAYRVADDDSAFEAVYVRPMNGQSEHPPAPRDVRAVQYFAYPEWKYQRLRDEYPSGDYEAAADIGPDRWLRLRLDIRGNALDVSIDGVTVLADVEAKAIPRTGVIGLWVDIGTEAFFSRLVVSRRG